MKDACHHLKHIQKKVVQENRRELERTGSFSNNEMAKGVSNNGTFVVNGEKSKQDREHRAPRVLPYSRSSPHIVR